MRPEVFEKEDKLYYSIYDAEPALEKAMSGLGFVKSGDAYIKAFPLSFPYREKIVSNFLKNAEAVIKTEARLAPMNWREGFEHFASIAQKAGIDWWTTGKMLLPLHGIDTDIDDVDFYFHEADLDKVSTMFADYLLEPIIAETHRSRAFQYYGMAYSHCPICMLVEPQPSLDLPEPVHFGQYAANHLESVNWNSYAIKVPPIELYINTLKRWGKLDFVEFVANALHCSA
jgi:hypothetical protein